MLGDFLDAGLNPADASRFQPGDHHVESYVFSLPAGQAGEPNALTSVVAQVVGEGDGHGGT